MPSLTDSTSTKMVQWPSQWEYFIQRGIFVGKIFIKDFLEELEMQEIKVTEEEMKKLAQFADSEGQVETKTDCKNFTTKQSIFVFKTIKFCF